LLGANNRMLRPARAAVLLVVVPRFPARILDSTSWQLHHEPTALELKTRIELYASKEDTLPSGLVARTNA
jgi:hypothetical protein